MKCEGLGCMDYISGTLEAVEFCSASFKGFHDIVFVA
jgi:hypothetical protein